MKIYGINGYVHLWRNPTQPKRVTTSNSSARSRNAKKKIILVMKLTAILITIFFIQVSASTKAQITLKENKASLEKILEKIGKQSGYDFIYSKQDFKDAEKLSINLNNVSVERALEVCFSNQPLTYEISDRTVMVKLKKDKSLLDRVIDYFTSIDVTGKVVDESGQAISGATIRVKGTNITTSSNDQGIFTLKNVDELAKLEISFLGYQLKEIKVSKNLGNIKMEMAVGKLEEVVVNKGYYTENQKLSTGSVSKVNAVDIEKQPVANILAVIQGRMAGVEIIQDSGAPGGSFNIKIRGQNSLRSDGNQPLYIIDGVPYSSETIGGTPTSGTMLTLTSPLNSINPSDIESIEVLKDADATAIYGSRGANGVVLITTKKTNPGESSFDINASKSFGKVTIVPKFMNTKQYLDMRRQAFANDGVTKYPAAAYDINGTWSQDRETNWQKELIGGTAEINNIQATVTGGSQKTQYLLSSNFRTETTVYPGDFKYGKGSVHFTMNHSSDDDRFKVFLSANYGSQKNYLPSVDLTAVSRTLAPNSPALYDDNGNLNWENGTWANPLAQMEQQFDSKIKDLNVNTVFTYNILKNLQLKTSLGYTDLKSNESKINPYTMYNPSFGLNSSSSSINTNQTARTSWIIEPQLNWFKIIGKGKIDALIGGTLQAQQTNRLFQFGSGFTSSSLIRDLASATTKSISISDETIYKYEALFARINYSLDEKYILNLTGRRDGSSRFGPGRKFALFGAVGTAWIFSSEEFLKDIRILSFGKLRMSYGITGNDQIGDYQFFDTYSSTGVAYQGTAGLQPARLYNPLFGWETNKKLEMALEIGLFKDRLFLTSAYYFNRSSNQLVGIPLPATTGFSSLNANLNATVENSGLEFTFRTLNVQRKAFEWTTNFNISSSRNKLISYPGLEGSTNANLYVVGKSINIKKLYQYTGMNPVTSIYEFKDVNNDGVITSLGDRKTVVDLNPSFFGGLENQFRFGRLQLDFLFQFVKQQAFSAMPGLPGIAVNQFANLSESMSKQPYTAGGNSAAVTAYSRYTSSNGILQDASYVRLKNLSLTYNLALKLMPNVKCQLYMQGQNLLTFTDYSNGDPEAKISNYLPPLKAYSAGIRLTF